MSCARVGVGVVGRQEAAAVEVMRHRHSRIRQTRIRRLAKQLEHPGPAVVSRGLQVVPGWPIRMAVRTRTDRVTTAEARRPVEDLDISQLAIKRCFLHPWA